MNFSNIRSDLATESLEQLEVGKHYQKEEYVNDGVKVEKVSILQAHQSINQGIGTYIEISFKDYLEQTAIIKEVVNNLKPLIDKIDYIKGWYSKFSRQRIPPFSILPLLFSTYFTLTISFYSHFS